MIIIFGHYLSKTENYGNFSPFLTKNTACTILLDPACLFKIAISSPCTLIPSCTTIRYCRVDFNFQFKHFFVKMFQPKFFDINSLLYQCTLISRNEFFVFHHVTGMYGNLQYENCVIFVFPYSKKISFRSCNQILLLTQSKHCKLISFKLSKLLLSTV